MAWILEKREGEVKEIRRVIQNQPGINGLETATIEFIQRSKNWYLPKIKQTSLGRLSREQSKCTS